MKSIVDYTNKLKDFFASNTALTTVWQLKDATQITATSSSHADLNTYTTPGNYSCVIDVTSSYVDNQPLTSSQKSFNLIVMRQLNSNNYLKQILLYYNSQYIWVRQSINGGSAWSTWARTIVNTDSGIDLKDANGNEVHLFASNEGGNLKLSKPNNSARLEIDTNNMDGSTGYARLMLGDATTPARKAFKFNEDGTFRDGNGLNLSNMLGGCYMRAIGNMSTNTLNIVASAGEQTFLVFLNQSGADDLWVLYRIETTGDWSAIRKAKIIGGGSTSLTITYAPATYTISIKPSADWFSGMILSTHSFTTSLS